MGSSAGTAAPSRFGTSPTSYTRDLIVITTTTTLQILVQKVPTSFIIEVNDETLTFYFK